MSSIQSTDRLGYSQGELVGESRDKLVVEAPLDMRIVTAHNNAVAQRFAITLRTPGDDSSLVMGYLFAEGIIDSAEDCEVEQPGDDQVLVRLKPWVELSERQLARGSIIHSGCGLCGKTFIEAVNSMQSAKNRKQAATPIVFSPDWLDRLNLEVQGRQALFDQTGGSHAAAMFERQGKLLHFAEDVGRHNALDKVTGMALLAAQEMSGNVLWISGRAGFELVQKAVMANVSMLVAVGAPSSLGVELAEESNLTLVAFARDGRANVYHQATEL